MKYTILTSLLALLSPVFTTPLLDSNSAPRGIISASTEGDGPVITPKVFIISLFDAEGDVWYENVNATGSIGDLLAHNITVPGFSPLFPQAHCLGDGTVCQLTTGEAEINAAATITALTLSPLFDLRSTYFLVAGIAGINPKLGTLADVCFSKFAVQVGLQFEVDARELPENFTTGYVPQGSHDPSIYPQWIYGTEVFELNEKLRDLAVGFASSAQLNDTDDAVAYRARYASPGAINAKYAYQSATRKPAIITCDVATADTFYSGALLGEAFENTTTLFTNGSAVYCMSAQEDNSVLESLIRAAMHSSVDFARIILMRAASDFDRPPPNMSAVQNLFVSPAGFIPSVENLYLAGNPVVKGILSGWETTFKGGVQAGNYVGDILGTLGGTPGFGFWKGPVFGTGGFQAHLAASGEISKRGVDAALNWRDRYPGGRVMKGRRRVGI